MSLVVVRATGLVTVQDHGRRGHMHEAVPPGGALVPELLVAANRRAHNPDDVPALEVLGQLVVRAQAPILVATDRDARELATGEELVVASGSRRCAYLAVRGGIEVRVILGGRGTLLCAGLGAPLRASEIIRAGTTPLARAPSHVVFDEGPTIAILPGPDLDAFASDAIAQLVASPYRVLSTSDRTGSRLAGTVVPRVVGYRERSRPMVRGALEVPGDGQPIVLGPEHPTTGGYPVIAVIASAELGRFHAIRPGGQVQFVAARLSPADLSGSR